MKIKEIIKQKPLLLWALFFSLISIIGFTAYYIFNNSSYKISFNANGGTKIQNIEIKENASLHALPTPSKSGYNFLGWYLDDDSLFDVTTPITKDITLTAKWENALVVPYTIKFDTLGGEEIEDIIIEEGNIIEEIPTPIKDTYIFKAWYYHNKEFDFNTPINSNLTLVAKYEKEID